MGDDITQRERRHDGRRRRMWATRVARIGRRTVPVAAVFALVALLLAPPASADAPASAPHAAAFEMEFLEMMIDHHQMAVHMSEMCFDEAVHAELLDLCESIHATQSAEIEQMQDWLADWYGIQHEPMMDDPDHHQQMAVLAALSGEAFEIAFLDMMVEHHAMAVVDGVHCLLQSEHDELRELCQSIVTSQIHEIVQMQVWLCLWYGGCEFRNPLAA